MVGNVILPMPSSMSSAQTRRVSALDKHQFEAKVHYFVTILEHKVNMQELNIHDIHT